MDNIPDIYTDSISIFLSDWGMTLDIRATGVPPASLPPDPGVPPQPPLLLLPEQKALVRMSHAHAKAFALILKRQLQAYEAQAGSIKLADRIAASLNITPEEW